MQSSPIIPFASTHPVRALPVARISGAQAELARLTGRGRQAALPALAPDATLTLHAATETAPSWRDPLTVHGSFGQIELVRGVRLLRALTGIDLGDDQHVPHWEWLQGAVCARLADTPLGGAVSLVREPVDAAPELVTLGLTLRDGGHLISTHGRASAADWLQLLAGPSWRHLQTPFDTYASLPLQWPVRLARHSLPHAMLAGLRPGDVLQPDSGAFDCSGQGRLTLGGLSATVRYQAPCSLIILALETRMDALHDLAQDAPHDTSGDGTAAIPAAALDQLPATLDIELGKLTLSLGALRSLAVGSTLLLAGADPAALEIRCGGQLLGRAEAVDVDGRLGVRITEWCAA